MFGLFNTHKHEPMPEAARPPKEKEKPKYEPTYPVRELFEAVKDTAEMDEVDFIHPAAINFAFHRSCYSIQYNMIGFCLVLHDGENILSWMSKEDVNWLGKQLLSHLTEKQKEKEEKDRQKCIAILSGDSTTEQ